MEKASRSFQIFVKPAGALCNLDCRYCYYLEKTSVYPDVQAFRMPDIILEEYIVQHIEASIESMIRFSWHGGEPTILGVDYFKKIVDLQRKHCPQDQKISNGMQTNGVLIDEEWCRFLADEGFAVGISLDGPQEMHDCYRVTKGGKPSFDQTKRGYELLRRHGIATDVLCVVNDHNVRYPKQVYNFFKQIEVPYVSFLPLVIPELGQKGTQVSKSSIRADAWGDFLCTVFDEWQSGDIGRIKVQIFEEAARTAFGQDHSLCIFRETCGDVPVIEHNGDFYSCDHFVDEEHRLGNIIETPLVELIEGPAQRSFGQAKRDTLPHYCLECVVLAMCNGGCPKNRFLLTPEGEKGLNYLCTGYKRFFTHCRPFVDEVAAQWHRQNPD